MTDAGESPATEPCTDLRVWRDKLGLNTYQAAQVLGISRTLVWQLERDGTRPSRTVRLAMFAISIDALAAEGIRPGSLTAEMAALRAKMAEASAFLAEIEAGYQQLGRKLGDSFRAADARQAAAAPALLEALEPFGEIDGEGDEDFPDETKVTVSFGRTTNYTLTLGDFRRASAALSNPEGRSNG